VTWRRDRYQGTGIEQPLAVRLYLHRAGVKARVIDQSRKYREWAKLDRFAVLEILAAFNFTASGTKSAAARMMLSVALP